MFNNYCQTTFYHAINKVWESVHSFVICVLVVRALWVGWAVLLWNFSVRMLPKVYIPNPALDWNDSLYPISDQRFIGVNDFYRLLHYIFNFFRRGREGEEYCPVCRFWQCKLCHILQVGPPLTSPHQNFRCVHTSPAPQSPSPKLETTPSPTMSTIFHINLKRLGRLLTTIGSFIYFFSENHTTCSHYF